MLRSMDSAVSGLQMHQQWMDVIGNNIANVSTPGFKASSVNFAQLFTQTLYGGGAPTATAGGTNPQQVGLGVGLGSITQNESQGTLQQTGNPTNLAIQGNGYFLLNMNGQGTGYTRVGDFSQDGSGNLVEQATGFKVQGWMATGGKLPTTETQTNLSNIVIPQNQSIPPQATANAAFTGNLNASDGAQTSPPKVQVPFQVYDSLGNPLNLICTFQASSTPGTWNYTVSDPSTAQVAHLGAGTGTTAVTGTGTTTVTGSITFSGSGAYATPATNPTITLSPTDGSTANQSVTLNFSQMTQYAAPDAPQAGQQDGYGTGTLTSLSVDNSGVITGHFTNGLSQTLGQVAMATFANPQGLVQQGQDVYTAGNNSGAANVLTAGTGGAGTIQSGALEGSNVDLAQEFTNMIAAERGFQANSQVVTTANQMLQTLVQLGQ